MAIESGRIQTLDQALSKLKEVVDYIHPLLSFERLNYNVLTSQHSQLREEAEKLKAKNVDAEAAIGKSVEAARLIVKQGEEERDRLKRAGAEYCARAYAKYKEFETFMSQVEQKAAKRHIKELEEVTA